MTALYNSNSLNLSTLNEVRKPTLVTRNSSLAKEKRFSLGNTNKSTMISSGLEQIEDTFLQYEPKGKRLLDTSKKTINAHRLATLRERGSGMNMNKPNQM